MTAVSVIGDEATKLYQPDVEHSKDFAIIEKGPLLMQYSLNLLTMICSPSEALLVKLS